MRYDLTIDQKLVKGDARKFLSKECDSTFVRSMAEDDVGDDPKLWKKMAELGWMGILVPEKYGESEMTFLEMAVLLFEMGYACLSSPFFSTAVVGVLTLLEAGTEDQKQALLPDVARGRRKLTLAWTEPYGNYSLTGIRTKAALKEGEYVLTGTKIFVPYAHVSDTIICAARTGEDKGKGEEGISLFLLDRASPALNVEVLRTISGEKLCEVRLEEVKVPSTNLLGKVHGGWPILKKILLKSAVAKCAEMSGGAEKALEMTVSYAKKREQFNRPIGGFQSIQHHCANMLTSVDTSKLMTFQSAWLIASGLPFENEASMTKVWVNESYRQLVSLGHQVMGGLGFMEEIDLQLYFKHAKASELAYGDATFHRELLAERMGL